MFLDYFQSKEHMVEEGHSLIPHDDPTLLWINSGVAALKKYFDGSIQPASNRIVNAQKSIRTNDIENVGKTARHHTFFEMLGNFSIGDYFKKEAIAYAWEFLTSDEWMGLAKDKLYVSVHTDDKEAYDIWVNEIGLSDKKILKTDDNFWQIGEGPSGPNTEIFYDRGTQFDPENRGESLFFEEIENDRYIELWNVVFSQYDAKEGVDRKDFKELPQKNIDTGLGLERLVSVIQEGETNFDTDLFLPIIKETEKYAKVKYEDNQEAFRVIADHIRTITFALSDGALFSNEGRGYVLRRIVRRAVRYGIQIGIEGSFMYKLVDVVTDVMNSYYPELKESAELVKKLVKVEEERFHLTLNDGEKMLTNLLAKDTLISGEDAFKLYDTYGFPLEMTQEIAQEKGGSVDIEGFKQHMAKQKEMSRAARLETQSMGSQHEDLLNFDEPSKFIGYSETATEARVIALFKEGHHVTELTGSGEVIFDRTVFYAESGGQVADSGMVSNDSVKAYVMDVQKAPHGQALHSLKIKQGFIKIGDQLNLAIDKERRLLIRRNHSSVHLLQAALLEVIGTHIHQAGSFVSDEYSRFDFSHYEKIDGKTLHEVEKLVNKWIVGGYPVVTEIMSMEDAKNSGAIALFDEKYTNRVRVLSMGDFSKELCGGTHVSNTSEIGVYKIISEESVGSGVRRIVAKTSWEAYEEFKSSESHLEKIAAGIGSNSVAKIDERLLQINKEMDELKTQIKEFNEMLVSVNVENLSQQLSDNQTLLFKSDLDSKFAKELVERLANRFKDAIIFGGFISEDKVTFVCAVGQPWIQKGFKAGDLVKEAAKITGGGGGGRPNFAQAGGKDLSQVDKVFETIETKLSL